MTPFLKNIAKIYYENHKTDISSYAFVFPNRRSGLFFRKYLCEMVEQPLFSPKILTINELFLSQSALRLADKLELLFRVYNIYKTESNASTTLSNRASTMVTERSRSTLNSNETFDVFAFWGEMLLGDFDDADKYLVDAKQLFTNLRELKEIDNLFDYLSPEQIEAIRSFWSDFTPAAESKNRQNFLATWQLLYPVYEKLRAELRQNALGYEGMIFRDVVEKIEQGETLFDDYEKIIFVGFNALTPCEKAVFKYLKKIGKADFYWDYSSPQTQEIANPASLFFRENVSAFPSKYEIDEGDAGRDAACHVSTEITLIGIPSAVGQAKEVYNILKELDLNEKSAFQTAVVLPEEKFLLPLLHSLPETLENVNVTMGYPLSFTPLAGLIDAVFELQRNVRRTDGTALFYHKNVLAILNHHYLKQNYRQDVLGFENLTRLIKENRFYIPEDELLASTTLSKQLLRSIFSIQTSPSEIANYLLRLLEELQTYFSNDASTSLSKRKNSLELEFLYHYYIAIKRIADLLNHWKIEMTADTFFRLLRKLTASISIPFSGEPLSGLQIMGVLETRVIDFDTLIITSMNEGIFPKKQSAPSFVPYNLRKGFGMPTTEHQDSIFAYHFYRLIHRAKKIFFLYDTRTEGLQSGEASRFIHQLRYLYKLPIKEKLLTYDISTAERPPLTIEKTPEIMQRLALFYSQDEGKQSLSASAVNAYLDCPLKFYFSYIEKLKENVEISENVEGSDFGTIFHAVMQSIYNEQSARNQHFTAEILQEIAKNDAYIEKQITKAFAEKYFKISDKEKAEKLRLSGQYSIIAFILKKYVKQMLRVDARYAPFVYVQSEFDLKTTFPVGGKNVNIRGFIDRIDEKNGNTRIIDYKTGGDVKTNFSDLEQLFEHEKYGRPKEILQLFMYALLYPKQNLSTAIIHLRNLFGEDDFYKKATITDDFEPLKDDFRQIFTACLEEIFDEEIPFCQTNEVRFCEYCAFREICRR